MEIRAQIQQVLTQAGFESEVDVAGDLYVTTGLDIPVWISNTPDKMFIILTTYAGVQDGARDSEIEKLANAINYSFFPNSVTYKDQKLWSFYYIPIIAAFDAVVFMGILRISSRNFVAAIRSLDIQNYIL